MTEIQALEPQMIERYLRGRDLKFLINQDGRFIVHFYGENVPDYRVGLSVEGPHSEVLGVTVAAETPYPHNVRTSAEAFVSGWNRSKRWPKAYLDDDRRGRGFWIYGENSFPLRTGVHQALFEELLDTSIATGRQLVRESASALKGVEELNDWLRQVG